MNKSEFLDALQTAHAEWEAALAQVGEARMNEPGVVGDWTTKDAIAHVTWFEREMVGVLRARALIGSDLWNLPPDQRNAAIFEQNRQRSLSDVLTEAREVFPQLVELAQALDDRDLNDPSRFADMPADWVPWQVIAGNTFEHYRAHVSDLRAWMKTQ
jgi:hypothetical protein